MAFFILPTHLTSRLSDMTTYQQTLDYLYAVLPMYQRVGAAAYKKDLHNTIRLCTELGDPHLKFKSIHVAGTNGKGSSSHMLAAILQSQGYKTGLYTSPHLKEFTERIKINGIDISRDYVIEFVQRVKPLIDEVKPSFFEITVAMAFDYFAHEKIDYAVIEVGLGGRLDSTNVITPLVSLITNIGWDHKDILGNTLQLIASEKAGIIKPNTPAVISERQPEIEQVFVSKAREVGAKLSFAEDTYQISVADEHEMHFEAQRTGGDKRLLQSELKGLYQQKNLAGVLAVVDELRSLGVALSEQSIVHGIKNTVQLTGLKGRWQKLGDKPLMYCDTGHNAEGLGEVLKMISKMKYSNLHIVLGMVADKDHSAVLSLLPKQARYYFCQANIPRALDARQLQAKALPFDLKGESFGEVNSAIQGARQNASVDDFIFIGGSTFVVAEIEGL